MFFRSFCKHKLTKTEILILELRKEIMTALDDLSKSVDDLGAAVTAEVAALADAIAKEGVDLSPAIEAQVARVQAATKALTDSVTPPAPPVETPPVDVPPADEVPAS